MKHNRCQQCHDDDERYCPHRGVFVVYIRGVRTVIVSDSEESARKTANKLRMKLKGVQFHSPKHPMDATNCFVRM